EPVEKGIQLEDKVRYKRKLTPTPANIWKMNYDNYLLDPSKSMELKIRKPDKTERTLTIKAQTLTDKEFRAEIKERKEKLKARKEKDDFEPFKCKEVSTE